MWLNQVDQVFKPSFSFGAVFSRKNEGDHVFKPGLLLGGLSFSSTSIYNLHGLSL